MPLFVFVKIGFALAFVRSVASLEHSKAPKEIRLVISSLDALDLIYLLELK